MHISLCISAAIVTSFKDLHKRNKQLFLTIPPMLHKSIWNFVQEYPSQFNEVLNNSYPSLESKYMHVLYMLLYMHVLYMYMHGPTCSWPFGLSSSYPRIEPVKL